MRLIILAFSLFIFVLSARTAAFADADGCRALFRHQTKQEINVQLARAAGLRYLEGAEPGYSRLKDEQGHFSYIFPDGSQVTDDVTLERIAKLKIPPAWKSVWVSMDSKTHVQARGTDARDRAQSRYHDIWESEVTDVAKFDRMERFGHVIMHLRDSVKQDLTLDPGSENARLAAIVRLMEVAGIRVGGEKYARENEHYGLTTLQVRHVKIEGLTTAFNFVGKEGRSHFVDISDNEVASLVKYIIAGKVQDASVFGTTSSAVNAYVKKNAGAEFSAKDIRTWVGTTSAAKVLIDHGAPLNSEDAKVAEKAAAVAASLRLRNEPDTARDNYVDPRVIEAFRDGRLAKVAQQDKLSAEAVVLRLLSTP